MLRIYEPATSFVTPRMRIPKIYTRHQGEQLPHRGVEDLIARCKILSYYRNNQGRMVYDSYRRRGLLIGSGPIEASHRNVIQYRLKLAGQRWTEQGTQRVGNLRMLNPAIFTQLPLSSADSTHIARSVSLDTKWKGTYVPINPSVRGIVLAERIEGHQSALVWAGREIGSASTLA